MIFTVHTELIDQCKHSADEQELNMKAIQKRIIIKVGKGKVCTKLSNEISAKGKCLRGRKFREWGCCIVSTVTALAQSPQLDFPHTICGDKKWTEDAWGSG